MAADGTWLPIRFLVDTGADRTAFDADTLAQLQLQPLAPDVQLGGVGGVTESVVVDTQVQLPRDDKGTAVFNGRFAAFTDPEALDMSVLGRDITNLFALIVDRPGDVVCLIGQRHRYAIESI